MKLNKKKYRQTDKYKEYQKKYHKEYQKKYRQTDKYKKYQKEYHKEYYLKVTKPKRKLNTA